MALPVLAIPCAYFTVLPPFAAKVGHCAPNTGGALWLLIAEKSKIAKSGRMGYGALR